MAAQRRQRPRPLSLARRPGRPVSSAANGRMHADVADIQRARMLSAMFDVVYEHEAANVTVTHVVERSGVSRRTFYEAFADREECFMAALEEAIATASERVLAAYRSRERWHERIRAGLVALLSFLDEKPGMGRMLIVESVAAGRLALERRARLLDQVTCAVDEGRRYARAGVEPTPLTAEGVVGGVLSVLHARIAQPTDGDPLVGLTGQLMSMIVLPYMGVGAARRELRRRPVETLAGRGQEHEPLLSDPFKEAGLRLTYRTVRVLMAIAAQPNASNRMIGERAEIKDQGQISKLLGRLERIHLISNTGLGPGLGAPNAWSLTAAGAQVVQSLHAHTGTTSDTK
jgi:AcrR family transcriptional regulator